MNWALVSVTSWEVVVLLGVGECAGPVCREEIGISTFVHL